MRGLFHNGMPYIYVYMAAQLQAMAGHKVLFYIDLYLATIKLLRAMVITSLGQVRKGYLSNFSLPCIGSAFLLRIYDISKSFLNIPEARAFGIYTHMLPV